MRRLSIILILAAAPAVAALTPDQKEFDFRLLASMYAKNYAPHEWKQQLFGFNLFDIEGWVSRARASADDLGFYEVCAEYVSSFRDAHTNYSFYSTFAADLGFHSDIYDGKVMIDAINRTRLPQQDLPFGVGWEVVSIDGIPARTLMNRFARFISAADERTLQRWSAQRLAQRFQSSFPRAHEIGDTAEVVLRNPHGEESTYTLEWEKRGTPVTSAGRVPSPKFQVPGRTVQPDVGEDWLPAWLAPLAELHTAKVETEPDAVLGIGSLNPIYAPPAGFQRRFTSPNAFLSGTYSFAGQQIGLIRIPNFSPPSINTALQQWNTEIAFMQANTDGLVIDVTRNGGGNICYTEEIVRRLIPYQFRATGMEFRATRLVVNAFSSMVESAKASGAPDYVIAQAEANLATVLAAYREHRGRTGPISICSYSLDRVPAPVVYSKPILVLIDEFSISAAEMFASLIQDNQRGPLFGFRTNGAGGSVITGRATVYSEATARFTASLVHRKEMVVTRPSDGAVCREHRGTARHGLRHDDRGEPAGRRTCVYRSLQYSGRGAYPAEPVTAWLGVLNFKTPSEAAARVQPTDSRALMRPPHPAETPVTA
jgi:hypothetical protein